jgi:ribosomal protein S18 acetylase RimI-like enzyme
VTVEKNDRPGQTREIEIRDLEIDDLAPVFHLGERTFTSDIPNLYRMWDEYEVTSLFTTEPNLCLVAEDRATGAVAGFALATTVTKPRSPWKYGYLVWMAVEESYRKLGIGGRLLWRVADRMVKEGVRILIVDTAADNERAVAFFEAEGFEHPLEHVYLSLNLDERRRRVLRREP